MIRIIRYRVTALSIRLLTRVMTKVRLVAVLRKDSNRLHGLLRERIRMLPIVAVMNITIMLCLMYLIVEAT